MCHSKVKKYPMSCILYLWKSPPKLMQNLKTCLAIYKHHHNCNCPAKNVILFPSLPSQNMSVNHCPMCSPQPSPKWARLPLSPLVSVRCVSSPSRQRKHCSSLQERAGARSLTTDRNPSSQAQTERYKICSEIPYETRLSCGWNSRKSKADRLNFKTKFQEQALPRDSCISLDSQGLHKSMFPWNKISWYSHFLWH